MMEEVWKPIEGYEGKYSVSNLGRVWSHRNDRELGYDDTNLYLRVTLSKMVDGKKKAKKFFVHRLVACAFLPNPDNLPQVNHKDEDKHNNRANNLEWCSVSYNVTYNGIHKGIETACSKRVRVTEPNGTVREFESQTLAAKHYGWCIQTIANWSRNRYPTRKFGDGYIVERI